jgi:hypothetical protein
MRQEIRDYLKEFKVNVPEFELMESPYGKEIGFALVNEVQQPEPGDDPIKKLIYGAVSQKFNPATKQFDINLDQVEERVLSEVSIKMTSFIESNIEAAKPRQTALWRWFAQNPPTPPVLEGLFLLYKYVAPRCSSDRMTYIDSDKTHMKNALLILEAMHKRYS